MIIEVTSKSYGHKEYFTNVKKVENITKRDGVNNNCEYFRLVMNDGFGFDREFNSSLWTNKPVNEIPPFKPKEDIKMQNITVGDESLTESQKKISDIMDSMKDLLLYKNKLYGDSALKPKKGWYKGDSLNSILIRLNDKQSRIDNGPEIPRINDVADIIGYCTLLLVSMGVTKEDIAKFKD